MTGLTVLLCLLAAASEAVEVAPGSVVRWTGENATRCRQEGRSWPALRGTCYFPIDLLQGEGPLEVARETPEGWQTRRIRVGAYPYPVQAIEIEDDSRVHLSESDLARVREENARIGALWRLDGPARFSLPLGSPLEELPEGGRFGSRRIFNGEPRSPHSGADFSAAKGTPILAVAAGEVRLAEEHFFAGKSVFVHHGDGLISMYFHLDRILVEKGQEVERGERLGEVGSTGRATGPHLHLGVRWHRKRIDPQALLSRPESLPDLAAAGSS